MQFHRRRFLHLSAGAAIFPMAPGLAWAQTYPARPVRIIVAYGPASLNDFPAQTIGQFLTKRLGQNFVIDHLPGENTNVGTEAAVRAAPDGYTLLLTPPPAAINATLYGKLDFNVQRDIAPVGGIMRTPYVMAIHPSLPAKTVPEFIAYAKANPGRIKMASAGTGNGFHLAGELFKMMTGVDLTHVPYLGPGPALAAVNSGEAQVIFADLPRLIAPVKASEVRALAVMTATRSATFPDVPPVGDFVPGCEASIWFGLGAPKNTPAEIIATLNREINAGLADRTIKAQLAEQGATPLPGSPADFGRLLAEETEKWSKVVRFAGIKPA